MGLDLLGEVETAGEFDLAASTLTKILSNIAQSPEADKVWPSTLHCVPGSDGSPLSLSPPPLGAPQFRRLRMGNAKISALLATRGVRAILVGVGFVEEGDALFLPLDAPLDSLQQAVASLAAQQAARLDQAQAQNAALQAQRKAEAEKENEERKRMKLQVRRRSRPPRKTCAQWNDSAPQLCPYLRLTQISDDAAHRSEPGWTAKVMRP